MLSVFCKKSALVIHVSGVMIIAGKHVDFDLPYYVCLSSHTFGREDSSGDVAISKICVHDDEIDSAKWDDASYASFANICRKNIQSITCVTSPFLGISAACSIVHGVMQRIDEAINATEFISEI